jgi:ubiquinone/menaquinone biosynthesis C-methylase UbiE
VSTVTLQPDDLRTAATACQAALTPALQDNWSVRAGDLEWDCVRTLNHVNDALFNYNRNLGGRSTRRLAVFREQYPYAPLEELLNLTAALAAALAEIAKAAPPEARGFHVFGRADASGFIAMGCTETLIHTYDIAQGLQRAFTPPDELCARLARRLFPWAPTDVDGWSALRWACGRIALPGHPRLGPDWGWHCAPLEEWDGTIKTAPKPSVAPRPVTIERLSAGVFPAYAMLAAMQLDLFTPLKDAALTPEELARTLKVGAQKLSPLLYALRAAGLLTLEDGRFGNTEEAQRFLVRGSPAYMGSVHELWQDIWQATLKTAESIRTGSPQAKHDFTQMSDAELEAFFRGLHAGALAAGRSLQAHFDFSGYRDLLDVGGGSGGVALALAAAVPQLRATIVDLDRVVPITRRFVAEAGLTDRVQAVVGDVTRAPIPGSFDVAVLRSFIQVLGEKDAGAAIVNVAKAVRPGASIYIVGVGILDDFRVAPPEAAAFNLVFLNVYENGKAYTESEYRAWLGAAGFQDIERGTLPSGVQFFRARRAPA